jgi:hypothetical protein
MKKGKFITVRYAESDLKLVTEKAKNLGLTISVYIRSISLSDKNIIELKVENTITKNATTDENEIRILLNIANNLNHITKIANQQKEVPPLDYLINIINRIATYLNKKFDDN